MHAPDQFMIYHLHEWDTEKLKWKKKPVGLQGEALMVGAGIPTSVDRAYVAAQCAQLGAQHRVGLWLAPASNFFFIDLDDDAVDANGNLTPLAAQIAAPFIHAGCYFEPSSSGRGAHVIGRCSVALPEHANSRKRVHPHEFYTRDRGCVLTTGKWHGDWNVDAGALLPAMLAEYFPPRIASDVVHALGDGPRKEWRGPVDDDDLIRKMLGAAGSAAARMQGKVSLAKLWAGECEHDSESDMALAAHLAFWTGADVERTERLMMRSGIKRDKWFEMRRDVTYLRQTVINCCVSTANVYQEPIRLDTASLLLGVKPPVLAPLVLQPMAAMSVDSDGVIEDATVVQDWHSLVDASVARVNSAGTRKELLDDVMPSMAAFGFPKIHGDVVASAFVRKADTFDMKVSISDARRLVMPPRDASIVTLQTPPEWAQNIVFVNATSEYFDVSTAEAHNVTALRAKFSRYMPMKQSGVREDPAQWLEQQWNMTIVSDVEYRPDQSAIFEADGRIYANDFRLSSIPTPAVGSDECTACIELFKAHVFEVVSRRESLYYALMNWIAHNARYPGKKIRWSPLIQGAAGVGKSIFTDLFNAVLGRTNVKSTSSASLSNSGGFTDWAVGAAVNVIEELKLDSKEARKLYNTMKTYIADDSINVNRKGRVSGRDMVNVTNHWANTNYRGTLPFDAGDRRWCVIFTPWEDADAAARSKGFTKADELTFFFNRIGSSMRREPGAWRSWLLGVDLSMFNPNGRAPFTDERDAMRAGSGDFVEQSVEDCIARGGYGISVDAFDSLSLMKNISTTMGEKPDNRSWNRILSELGYIQHPRTLWWNGFMRRVWSKKSASNEELRAMLDKTLPVVK